MNARTYVPETSVVLTLDDILNQEDAVEAQARSVSAEEAKLAAMVAALEQERAKLAAMRMFVPADKLAAARRERKKTPPPVIPAAQAAPVAAPPRVPAVSAPPVTNGLHPALVLGSDVTMQGSIVRVLTAAGRGMSHAELRESLDSVEELKKKWDNYEHAFYKAATHVIRRGVVIRHKGLLYAKDVFHDLQARGVELPESEGRALPRHSVGFAAHKVLEEHPEGLTGAQVREILLTKPKMPDSVREHPQYVLDVLSKLNKKGYIVREGNVFSVPKKAKG